MSSSISVTLRLGPPAVIMCFSGIISAQQDESEPAERPYVVLQKQNLVVLGSVVGVLLLLLIVMAVCVYKPLSRR